MKNKFRNFIIFLLILLTLSTTVISTSASWDDFVSSSTTDKGNSSSGSGSYLLKNTSPKALVGVRCSVVDSNGITKSGTKNTDIYFTSKTLYGNDIYLDGYVGGTNAADGGTKVYTFYGQKNKFECIKTLAYTGTWTMASKYNNVNKTYDYAPKTSNGTNYVYTAVADSQHISDVDKSISFTTNLNTTSSINLSSAIETWYKGSSNDYSVAKKIGEFCNLTSGFAANDILVIEPLFLVKLNDAMMVTTISELGLFTRLYTGSSTKYPASSGTENKFEFISNYTNRYFPNYLFTKEQVANCYATTAVDSTYVYTANDVKNGVTNAVEGALKSRATAQILVNYGFGMKALKCTTSNVVSGNYTVTYDANGGSGSMSNSTATYNENFVTRKNTFTRTGYTFDGWNEKADGTGVPWLLTSSGVYENGNGTKPWKWTYTKNITLYAQWAPTPYKITYNPNGGTYAGSTSNSTTSYNITSDITIAGTPTRTGYTFNGWKVTTAGGNWSSTAQYNAGQNIGTGKYGNVTLTAQWKFNVTFDANGGKWADGTSIDTQTYNAGDDVYILVAPTKTGYTFANWKITSASGDWTLNQTYAAQSSAYKSSKNGNVTFTAQWISSTPTTYTITYKWSDGTTITGLSPSTYTYSESNTPVASVPSVTGYTTKGWYTNSSCADNTSTGPYTSIAAKATGNITLYAKKTANPYTITFNGNGATSGSMPNIQMKYGMVNSSPITNQFKRTGYEFAGWSINGMTNSTHYRGQDSNVNTSFSGTTYAGPSNSTYFKNLRNTSGTVTLTAQWTPITYKITFNGNGATSGSMSDVTMTYDKVNTTAITNAFSKKGYTFAGWSISGMTNDITHYRGQSSSVNTSFTGTTYSGPSNSTYFKNLRSTSGTVTLTAQWTQDTYTITYKWSDGTTITGLSPSTYTYSESNTTVASVPSVTGYATKGWYQTSACSGSTVSSIAANVTGDKVFYATKTAYKLTINYYANGGVLEGESSTKTSVLLTQKFDYGSTAFSSSGVYNYTGTGGTLSMKKTGYTGTGNWLVDNTSSSAKTINQNTTYEKSQDLATAVGKNLANGNVTIALYAQWNPITYQIKYNGNGSTSGSMSNSTHTYDVAKNLTANAFKKELIVTFKYNSSAADTTKTASATFNGWAKTSTGDKSYNNQQSVINLASTQGAIVNLYAKWINGSVTLPTPTKTGYTFDGWYTASTGGTRIGGGGNSYTPTENTTLYAQWTPITYEVKYNGNGSTSGSMSNSTHTYDVAKNLTANAFKRVFTVTYVYNSSAADTTKTATATFNGWAKTATGNKSYNNQQSVKNLTSTQGAVVNLYAKWTDGSVTHPTPTKTGYTFTGWYTSSTGGTKVGEGGNSYTPTENTTLYAQWTPNTYNVYLYPNGGTKTTDVSFIPADNNVAHWKWETDNNRWVASFEYNSNKYVSIPVNNAAFTHVGYHQDGWKKDNATIFSEQTYNGSSDLHLYAQWKKNPDDVANNENTTYTVEHYKYLDDFGTWELIKTETKKADINDEVTEYPTPPFGYRCSEAETSITLPNWPGSELYKAPKSISVRVTQNSSTKIIFRYVLDVCKITYNLNGGTYNNSENDYKITVDRLSTITLITPTKDGYTFAGWYLYVDENGGQGYQGTAGDEYIAYEDVTFYALWTRDDNFVDLQIVTNKLYGNIVPNKPFVASATILNLSDTDVIPSNPASIKLTISYLDENGNFKEVGNRTASVIVPARNKNLVFVDVDGINAPIGSELRFEWNLYYSNSTLVDYIQDNNYDSNIIADENGNIIKTKQSIKVTPYDFKSTTPTPEFTLTPNEEYTPTPSSTSINTYSWDVWEYKNGKFEIVSYSSKLPEDTTIAEITLTPENNEGLKETNGNNYITRSGYGFSADIKYTISKDIEFGEMRAALLVPEYSYKISNGIFEDLKTIETYNSDGTITYSSSLYPSDKETTTGIHYTPMWFPDGEYVTTLSIGGMWTPIGEFQAEICHGSMTEQEQEKYKIKTNKIIIDGSLYDDMYIVNDRFNDENE